MTDEVSQPDSTAATGSGQAGSPQAVSPPEPTPTPQAAPPVAAGSVPAPEPVAPDATVPPAVEVPPVTAVPAEVVNQISDPIREPTASNGAGVVTEAVQDLITPEKPVTPEGTPQMQNSEVSPPKSAAAAPPLPPPLAPAPPQNPPPRSSCAPPIRRLTYARGCAVAQTGAARKDYGNSNPQARNRKCRCARGTESLGSDGN